MPNGRWFYGRAAGLTGLPPEAARDDRPGAGFRVGRIAAGAMCC